MIGEILEIETLKLLSPQILEWRRYFHQYPELSFNEYQTSQNIKMILGSFTGIEVSSPTPTSVMGRLKGRREGHVVAIRADIDALPILEENNVEYASKNHGIMHACGHDAHAAILLGVAKYFSQHRDTFNGELRFIFQHAEELPPGGAVEILQSGALSNVDFIFAGHLWSQLPLGKIGIHEGPMMAAPDNFEIVIKGKGGHAAHPEETIDPILIGSHIVTNLQSLSSRQTSALEPLVVSITCFNGGSAYNIIPDSVTLQGTTRTFNLSLRQTLPEKIEQIIAGICKAYGADYSLNYKNGYEPVINNKAVTSFIKHIVQNLLGENSVEPISPRMGGEDFSAYLKDIPGAFFLIGAGNNDKGILFPQHHPKFDIDEDALNIALKVYCSIALKLLQGDLTITNFNKGRT